jgi:hypothetical protein
VELSGKAAPSFYANPTIQLEGPLDMSHHFDTPTAREDPRINLWTCERIIIGLFRLMM